jgi:multisubunit Na+/H+ antiporter MnhG subunit
MNIRIWKLINIKIKTLITAITVAITAPVVIKLLFENMVYFDYKRNSSYVMFVNKPFDSWESVQSNL